MKNTKKVGASGKVYDYVLNKIQNHEWKTGEKVMTENELCAELEVSRVAVRQALGRLVTIGLLEQKQGAGTYVGKLDSETYLKSLLPLLLLKEDEILHVLEFRKYFEYGNVEIFIDRYTDDDLMKLKHCYQEMAQNENNLEKFFIADFMFHETIALGTKNQVIIRISELLMDVLKAHQAILYERIGPSIGVEYHALLLKAIIEKDKELAGIYMKRHIQEAIQKFKNAVKTKSLITGMSD